MCKKKVQKLKFDLDLVLSRSRSSSHFHPLCCLSNVLLESQQEKCKPLNRKGGVATIPGIALLYYSSSYRRTGMKDYDETTAFLGQWGKFQKMNFFLLCASIIPNGFVFSIVFLTSTPNHHCLVPEANLTQDWHNATIPLEVLNGNQIRSQCSRYRLDVVRNLSAQGLVPGRDVNLTDVEQEGCVDGWSYSRDVYQSTVVTEFDLVCGDQWKTPVTTTVFFTGILLGSFISGQISDRFGRKPVLFATMAVQTVFTSIQIFSPSWTALCVLLFINGLGQVSNYMTGFVLGTEILTGKVRVLFSSMGVCLAFAIGYMLVPLFAFFLRDWKSFLWGMAIPGLAYIPLWWFIPESPRWLLSQGRVEEAEAIVRKAAKMNNVQPPPTIFTDYRLYQEKEHPQKHHNVFHLLRARNIRNTTIILCTVWLTLNTGYYGLSLNTSDMNADPYLSCFISAAVEVPAYVSSWLALRYLPRRHSAIFTLVTGALLLYFIQLVSQTLPALAVALEMLGKFTVTAGAALMFAYTAELYPTVLRNTATGTCYAFARVGSCIAPFVLNLSIYFEHLPFITLGSLAVVSAVAALFLPETFGQPLPQTIQEMHKTQIMRCPLIPQKQPPAPVEMFQSNLSV
ncbi:organic cation/carnitine transporter 2-like isoform X2 [Antennarius striatus]|uniref:organic cation/carnitine transporter 2-like isoform X2 n=1 Tax=Antennarius striatus TaxID=241820 RepID=UPI0035B11B4C